MEAPTDPTAARDFGGYELIELLARDAGGEFHRARRRADGLAVGIRIVPAGALDDRGLRRFLREAEDYRSVKEAAMAPLVEAGVLDGRPFAVTELPPGRSVAGALAAADGPAPRTVLGRLVDALRGLGRFHEQGLVHRNLHPEALRWTEDLRVVFVDPGFHRADAQRALDDPRAAPELAAGERDRIDGRADVFAIGRLLGEMGAGLHEGVAAISAQCTAADPESRTVTVRHVAFALRALPEG